MSELFINITGGVEKRLSLYNTVFSVQMNMSLDVLLYKTH